MFLNNGSQDLRKVEWGRTYRWDIRFLDAPTPFSDWFPATEIEENLWTLEPFGFEVFMSTYNIPKSTAEFSLKVTFYDDINQTLANWLSKWVNETILNDGKYIATLEESVKSVDVVKLNTYKEMVSIKRYSVFPTGSLFYNGTSESGTPQYTVDFAIAGSTDLFITA